MMSKAKRASLLSICILFFLSTCVFLNVFPNPGLEAKSGAASDAAPSVVRVRLSTGAVSEIGFTVSGAYSIPAGRLPEGSYRVRRHGDGLSLVNSAGAVLQVTSGPLLIQEHRNGGSSGMNLISLHARGSRRAYQGSMKFWPNGQGIEAINHVPLEKYLYGVVPYEMSNGFPMEALKAQAVAARCYVLRRLEGNRGGRHDIGDTASDQVYKGYQASADRVRAAVDATAGQVLQFKGATILAYYAASNGGQTERSENVWSTALPYAKLRADPYDLANPSSFQQFAYFPAGSTADKPEDRRPPLIASARTSANASSKAQSAQTIQMSSTAGVAASSVPKAMSPYVQPNTSLSPVVPGLVEDPSDTLAATSQDASPATPGAALDAAPGAAPDEGGEPEKAVDPLDIINAFDASGLLTVNATTYLRTGPGATFSRIAQLKAGLKVSIVSPGEAWHFVSHEGQFGYVPAEDIRPLIIIRKPAPAKTPENAPAKPDAVAPSATTNSAADPGSAVAPSATTNSAADPGSDPSASQAPLPEAIVPATPAAPTPVPQPTIAATPTLPPQPTIAATPTPVPQPTATPTPVPKPTSVPKPTATPKPSGKVPSTATVSASAAVKPAKAAWSNVPAQGAYADEHMDRRLADFIRSQAVRLLNARNANTPAGSRFVASAERIRIKAILDMTPLQVASERQCDHDPDATDGPPHTAANCPSIACTGVHMRILLKVLKEDRTRVGGYDKVDISWDFQFVIDDLLKSKAFPQWQVFTPGNGLRIFAVEKVLDPKGTPAYALVNRRYGHGVGMSQRGAQQRAKDPDPAISQYQNILAFYYPGTKLVATRLVAPALPAAPARWAQALPASAAPAKPAAPPKGPPAAQTAAAGPA